MSGSYKSFAEQLLQHFSSQPKVQKRREPSVDLGLKSRNKIRRKNRNITVEECRIIEARSILQKGQTPRVGLNGSVPILDGTGRVLDYATFVIQGEAENPVLFLDFETDSGLVRQAGNLQVSMMPGGQLRWWFGCPFYFEDFVCNRRVAKLYLPPGRDLFGCRECHELTYAKCQQGHAPKKTPRSSPSLLDQIDMLLKALT